MASTAEELTLVGVQEIVERSEQQLLAVPLPFVRPPHDRPQYLHGLHELPIIDVSGLLSPQTRPEVLNHISLACIHSGFFQAINHGVPEEVVAEMRAACLRFFSQPAQERNKFRGQPKEASVVYTSSVDLYAELARDWRDSLYVQDAPAGVGCDGFDIVPDMCREAFKEYRKEAEKIANVLYEAIFESLGLSLAYVKEAVPAIPRLVMAVNYYPPCPDPSLTYGLHGHTDISSLTVLLQDEVPGLQIRKGDDWVYVMPALPNAVVFNVGDQIEILSNGKYKSVEHRVLTNSEKPRISVGCFFKPNEDETIAPLSKLVSESKPALYKEVKFADYKKNFRSNRPKPTKGTSAVLVAK